jgi:hypothetical protein
MAYDYLTDLNPQQRRAVKHGVRDGSAIGTSPLLVIAGGTGKTKTLAHRAARSYLLLATATTSFAALSPSFNGSALCQFLTV